MQQPLILALETSTHACSVALSTPGRIFAEYVVEPQIHSQVILPMVDKILAQAGVQLADLSAMAFGQGPGSFTGVRIAASVVQGLAFGADKLVVPISSLRALAQLGYAQTGAEDIIASIDARMGEIYWGAYRANADGIMETVVADCVSVAISHPSIDLSKFVHVGMDNPAVPYPRAQEVAQLAVVEFLRGAGVPASEAIPVYIRNDVIQADKQKNSGKKNPD